MAWYNWSRTTASNTTADVTINWQEGQAPSSVNDSARAMMARTAEYRDDVAGAITTGGSSTAYTLTSFQVFDTLAHLSGQMIAFTPHATNTNAAGVDMTLNVDGLGAKSIRMQPSIALPTGTLVLGTPYIVTYNNADSVFYLRNMTNPYSVPLAAGLDYWSNVAPNSAFAFPKGQAISRTTYATLFTAIGVAYGSGDGSTTFNLPDKMGRVSAMKEDSSTRLTGTYFGGTSTVLNAVGGSESQTMTLAQLPTGITSANASQAISVTSTSGQVWQGVNSNLIAGGGPNGVATIAGLVSTGNNSISVTSNNTSGTAHPIVQPTIICNYIMRII